MSINSELAPCPPQVPLARVAFVGAGPGDPGLLTVRGRDYLARADVVIVDSLDHAEDVRPYTRPGVEIVDGSPASTGKELAAASRAKLVVTTATTLADPAKLVLRLMDGDPAAFSSLATEAAACRRAGIAFEIVPGVSTASSVPLYAGVPLSSGQNGSQLHMFDGSDASVDYSLSISADVTVVVQGEPTQVRSALGELLKAGRDGSTSVALTEHGTTVDQRTEVSCLREAQRVMATELPHATLAVIGSQVDLRTELSWYETKSLFGWRIVVPRTKDQAGSMVQRLASHGASAQVVPTISVEPPRTPQQMDKAIKGLVTGRYEWVGFTSVNAVRAVREKFTALGLDARSFSGLKIAAVGGVTAAALRDWGLEPDLVPSTEQSARGLLEAWPPYDDILDPINRIFLPRADIATDTLIAGLIKMGWAVDDVTAYRTVRAAPPALKVRDAIKSGAFDAVCFTSSSTVRNLIGIAGKPHPNTLVACIGPATARTAEEHGLSVDVVSPSPSGDALVDALAEHVSELTRAASANAQPLTRPSQRPSRRPSRRASRGRQ